VQETGGHRRLNAFLALLVPFLVAMTCLAIVSGVEVLPVTEKWLDLIRGLDRAFEAPSQEPDTLYAFTNTYGANTWYFAHGVSVPDSYHTWFLLANPRAVETTATVTFFLEGGETKTVQVEVAALSRVALYANEHVSGTFAATVSSTEPLVAEESVFFANDGYTVPGVGTPSTVWYFAEGSNSETYETHLYLFNPNSTAASVTINFYDENGNRYSVSRQVPARQPQHVNFAEICPVRAAVSTEVASALPLVAQRLTFFPGRDGGRGGHASVGISMPATTWYMPLAQVNELYDTWLMLFNPGDTTTTVNATFLAAQTSEQAEYVVPPHTRATIWLDKENAEGRAPDGTYGVVLTSSATFIAESVVYDSAYQVGSATTGSPCSAREWYFAEGSTAPPYTTQLALFNPGPTGALIKASVLGSGNLPSPTGWALLPGQLELVNLNETIPEAHMGLAISSDEPIVAMRIMTMTGSGLLGALGLASIPQTGEPAAFLPIVVSEPQPTATATETATPDPDEGPTPTPTRVRPAESTTYMLSSPITGTANCGTTGLRGRITDPTGQPLAGVKVRVWAEGWSGTYSNPTDANGVWDCVLGTGAVEGRWYAAVAGDDGTLLSPIVALPTSSDCHNGHQWLEINWQVREEAAPEYVLAWSRRLCCIENCGNHNIYIDVTDAEGNGLGEVMLRVSWAGGYQDIETGHKLDIGPGRVEFPMYKGTYSVQVLDGSSDTANSLTVELPDETACDNHGNTRYHYSYHVVFRKQ